MKEKKIFVKDLFRIQENVELLQGLFNCEILNCTTNSKDILEGGTFFAIDKGNDYVEDAINNGAKLCIVETNISNDLLKKYSKVTFVKTQNALESLQNLAAYKRSLYDIPVIAITGSVGKTSTKDIVASVMSKKFNVLKTEGNFNNHIGLPLTILRLENHNAMVLEMGMNHFHEIEKLTKIAKPTIAIITNIGTSHIGLLGSRRNIMKAKLEILIGLKKDGYLIINNDCDLLHNWKEKENKSEDFKVFTYGIKEKSDLNALNIDIRENNSSFNIQYNNNILKEKIEVLVPGEAFIYNSLAAISVAKILNIEYNYVKDAIKTFELTKKRMEVETIDEIKYINDAYNASYESMKSAINYLGRIKANRKIAVLGDMFELGDFTEELHRKVGKEIEKCDIDILITAGTYSKYINEEIKKEIEKIHLNNKNEVINKINEIKKPGDVFLIKASNGMKFYEIVDEIRKM